MLPPGFEPDGPGNGEGIFGLPTGPAEAEVVILPVPWEATVSYGSGAADGPRAIFEASQQVDLYDVETGRPYERGIALLPGSPEIPVWTREAKSRVERILAETEGVGAPFPLPRDHAQAQDFRRVEELGQVLNQYVEKETASWLARGKLVGLIGGDHSSPLGAIRAGAAQTAPASMGVLQIDAHADLRTAYMGFRWSHASIFDNVLREIPDLERLVQVGLRDLGNHEAERIATDDRIRAFFDAELQSDLARGTPWTELCAAIIKELPQQVWISVDIDGLDPSLCPHTGTPVPGGLSFNQLTLLLSALVSSGRRIVGFDLCEVAPDPEGKSDWDGNVGARVLYKLIGFALKSR